MIMHFTKIFLKEFVARGCMIRLENIHDDNSKMESDKLYSFFADFIIEGKDSCQIIKELIRVRNDKITYITDF